MKQLYTLAGFLLLSGSVLGQGTELFFSEVVEGSGANNNDKAIEVFNPTLQVVNITQYSIRRYSNGSSNPTEDEKLVPANGNVNLPSAEVYVLANPTAADAHILSEADQLSGPHSSSGGGSAPNTILGGGAMYANGDDAMALVRWIGGTPGSASATPVIVDIFGKIGEQPPLGNGWSGVQVGPVSTIGSANHSIVRKSHVESGVTVNPTTFEITQEWLAYSVSNFGQPGPAQNYSRLGEHADYTGTFGNYVMSADLAAFDNSIKMYPNPAKDRVTINLEKSNVGTIALVNSLGQQVVVQRAGFGSETVELNTGNFTSGLYFVKFISQDGQIAIYKELIIQ